MENGLFIRTQLFPQPSSQPLNPQASLPPRQYVKIGYGGEMIPPVSIPSIQIIWYGCGTKSSFSHGIFFLLTYSKVSWF